MTFKTFGISGFRIFAYTFILALTTSLKRTVKHSEKGLCKKKKLKNRSTLKFSA
jgi:hypothetical protein